MANEIEQDNLSFGIQDTVQMGMGNQELLDNILAPETSTADPDKIVDINDTTAADKIKAEEDAAAAKIVADKKIVKDKKDTTLGDFLSDDDDVDDDKEVDDVDDDDAAKTAAEKIKAAAEIPNSDDTSDDTSGGTQFEALSNDLFELGVFNKDEDENEDPITTAESFLERFNVEKKKGAMEMVDNFIGQFGKEHQDAFDAIYVKGMDPREYFQASNSITDFSKLDLTIEANQEKVMKQTLSDQGFEQDDVDSEIERLKNYGDLEVVSQKHHKVLIKKQTKTLEQKTIEADNTRKHTASMKQTYVNNVNDVLQDKIKEKGFDGIPLSPKIANELQDFLLADKWKTDSGETLTDFDKYILDLKRPENHETKVKVALLLKLLEKDPTLSTIKKSSMSKKSDKLFKEVSRQVSRTSNTAGAQKRWFK